MEGNLQPNRSLCPRDSSQDHKTPHRTIGATGTQTSCAVRRPTPAQACARVGVSVEVHIQAPPWVFGGWRGLRGGSWRAIGAGSQSRQPPWPDHHPGQTALAPSPPPPPPHEFGSPHTVSRVDTPPPPLLQFSGDGTRARTGDLPTWWHAFG